MAKRNLIVRFVACLLFIVCSFTGTAAQQAEVFPVVSVDPEIQFAELSDLTYDAHEDVFWAVSDDRQANGHQIFKIKIENGEARITRGLILNRHGVSYHDIDYSPDLEGITIDKDEDLWVCEERKFFFLIVDKETGAVQDSIQFPTDIFDFTKTGTVIKKNRGMEGLAFNASKTKVYTCVQKPLLTDRQDRGRIIEYDLAAGTFDTLFAPMSLPDSTLYSGPDGKVEIGWNGISFLSNDEFLLIERDNQTGDQAVHKKIWRLNLSQMDADRVIPRSLVADLTEYGYDHEKPEGIAVKGNAIYIINDDDDGSNTALWKIPLAPLTILHTNDTHAHLDDIARRATAIQQVRDGVGTENVLLLDAGDVFTGALYFNLYKGMADLDFMNILRYDAMCLGNHEFDNFATTPEDLTNFVAGAGFPILCANFDFSNEPDLVGEIKPWISLNVAAERIGIFGLTTEETAAISSPGDKITINDHIAAAKEAVAALEAQGINKIIALTHLGWNNDLELAHQVQGIDIVVGGHSDTVPEEYPTVVDGAEPVLVVQAGGHGKYLGKLNVSFDEDGVVQIYGGQLLKVRNFGEDPDCVAKLAEYQGPIEELKNTVIGETLVDLDGERAHVRTQETNLGNLITDAMLDKASCVNATIAIQNGGGIRASIPAGDISLGQIMEVQPFGNYLVAFDLTGEQIIAALENGVSQVENVKGRFPQVAGLRYTWDPSKAPGERIISVEVKTTAGYQPIDPSASYCIVTNNFLYGGGDGYTVFQEGTNFVNLGFVDYEMMREYLEKSSPVNPEVEGRILTRVTAVEEEVSNMLPETFTLYPIFPNPFNPGATIRYSLAVQSRVRLAVYDVLGQQVVLLHEGVQHAGTYRARFDGTELGTGVYFCRLEAGRFSQTRKMLLVK